MTNMVDVIEKMKKSAMARCAERVESAKKNPKKNPCECEEEHGMTSRLKKDRGL